MRPDAWLHLDQRGLSKLTTPAALIPELYVDDLDRSIAFYTAIGFRVVYGRPAERFAMIEREDARIMLEQPIGRILGLFDPASKRGIGINLQIAVSNLDHLKNTLSPRTEIILPAETKTYSRSEDEVTVRQMVIADPDGYLLRFSQTVAVRPVRPPARP